MLNQTTHIPARLPENHPPVLLVVIDTEEEFDWSQPFSRTNTFTTAIAAQPIAHTRVFDKFGIVPTYVIDWPVATTPSAVSTMRALMENDQCEIGAHLHPWVSPPHTEIVSSYNSYAGNLPKELEFEKLRSLTNAITENFGRAPLTFKAGRYGVGTHTSEIIASLGYKIDASIVPYTSFDSDGGPKFSKYSEQPFWFGNKTQPLLELPATTGFCGRLRRFGSTIYPTLASKHLNALRLRGIAARSGMLERIRLTPEGGSASDMIRLTSALRRSGCQVFTLTYHSPSIVPRNTPYVRSNEELAAFFDAIDKYCAYFRDEIGGTFMSISKLHEILASQHKIKKSIDNN
ncbi:MAG: polysaccharide deacetylase family protein [Burkholderiaceae bacterium]